MFAMPETGIGFFPDVGGTYFLPRLTGRTGYYLGLTGARIGADDCITTGIAQHKVTAESLTDIVNAIARQPFKNDAKLAVTEVINRFSIQVRQSPLSSAGDVISNCFSGISMEEIVTSLRATNDEFSQNALKMIAKKSPASLKVTLKALIEGGQMDFDRCMVQEYCLSTHFLQGHDFKEGIRAVIIDKDQSPVWKPADLQGVSIEMVNQYFSPLMQDVIH
jgi:enoyl-CoA hydratase